jgi:PadR family transcriptional regulator
MEKLRLTKPTLAVLDSLLVSTLDDPPWGLRISAEADLNPSSTYGVLERLAESGWVTSWTEEDAHPGRPPRVFYALTDLGKELADQAMKAREVKRQRLAARIHHLVPGGSP